MCESQLIAAFSHKYWEVLKLLINSPGKKEQNSNYEWINLWKLIVKMSVKTKNYLLYLVCLDVCNAKPYTSEVYSKEE